MFYVFQELQKVGHWVTRLNPPRCLVHRLFLSLCCLATMSGLVHILQLPSFVSSPQPQGPDCTQVRSMDRSAEPLKSAENPRPHLECHDVRALMETPQCEPWWELQLTAPFTYKLLKRLWRPSSLIVKWNRVRVTGSRQSYTLWCDARTVLDKVTHPSEQEVLWRHSWCWFLSEEQ